MKSGPIAAVELAAKFMDPWAHRAKPILPVTAPQKASGLFRESLPIRYSTIPGMTFDPATNNALAGFGK